MKIKPSTIFFPTAVYIQMLAVVVADTIQQFVYDCMFFLGFRFVVDSTVCYLDGARADQQVLMPNKRTIACLQV